MCLFVFIIELVRGLTFVVLPHGSISPLGFVGSALRFTELDHWNRRRIRGLLATMAVALWNMGVQ